MRNLVHQSIPKLTVSKGCKERKTFSALASKSVNTFAPLCRIEWHKKLDSWFQQIDRVLPLALVVIAVIIAAVEIAFGIDISLIRLPWYSGFLAVGAIATVLIVVAILDTVLYTPWGKRRK